MTTKTETRCGICGHWQIEHDGGGCAGCDANGHSLEAIMHAYTPCTEHESCTEES